MPVRIVVLISITSLLIPNLVADLAHAEITSTSLTISASCVPGPLSISVPGTIVFPTVNAPSMVTTASSISTATMGTVLVTDARCDAPNTAWTASAIATALTPTAGPTIAAYGTLDATVTISVPANVISGEQYGVIWASANTPTHAFGIVTVSRVGIRMYDPIGTDLETTSSTTTTLSASHPSWTLDFQWTAIGLQFIAVAALAVREKSRSRRKRKKSKKPRKGS